MIELYTWRTPNGRKPIILLEETGLPYTVIPVPLDGTQKEAWFTAINPNGRIPALIDRETNVTVFESGAMMIYLAEKVGQFLPTAVQARADTLAWLMFQMAGIGPMMGQYYHFNHSAPEKLPYAITRYKEESRRLMSVLNSRLAQATYLAGDEYTIADMITYPWITKPTVWETSEGEFAHVSRWVALVASRPAVQRAMALPIGE
jgi:GSH-dependent disulfide-bond oxidoreductase